MAVVKYIVCIGNEVIYTNRVGKYLRNEEKVFVYVPLFDRWIVNGDKKWLDIAQNNIPKIIISKVLLSVANQFNSPLT